MAQRGNKQKIQFIYPDRKDETLQLPRSFIPAFREAVAGEVICRGQVPRRVPIEGLAEPDSLPLPSSTTSCSPMQITRSLICIRTSSFPYPPALGGRALGLADSSFFCLLLPSRELLLSPSTGAGGGRESRPGRAKQKKAHPQDKGGSRHLGRRKGRNATVWTWTPGKLVTEGQSPAGWSGISEVSALAAGPALSCTWLWNLCR